MKEFKKKTYFLMDVRELDELIRKELAPLTKNPARFKNFECIAEFEWNNYARYETSVNFSDFMSKIYKKYDRKDIMKGDPREMFGLHGLMSFMLENNIIREGNYLIDPSW